MVFYVLHLEWLLKLSKEEVTIPWIMVPALLLIAAYFGLFLAFPVHLADWVRRRAGISPAFTLPVFWVLFDYLRTLGEIAFSWGSVGYALSPWPAAIQGTAWAGFWILPPWILLGNGLLWEGLTRPRGRAWLLAGVLAVAVPVSGGGLILRQAPQTVWTGATSSSATLEPDGSRTAALGDSGAIGGLRPGQGSPGTESPRPDGSVRFGVVQANTPREIKWNPDYRELVVGDLVDKTYQIAREQRPDLIVWPETAAPLRVMWETPLREKVEACAAETGTWTLVGTLDAAKVEGEWEHYNSAILFSPTGAAVQRYHKRRMVPFGELTPYRKQIPLLAKADFGQSEFTPGREPGLFPIPGIGEVSCLICFESTFAALARKDVAAGAEFLVNITNDFWFGGGAGPIQHERFANLRACETRTPLIRCGNTGISCVIDPYGRVHGATELFETVLRSYDVVPGRGGGLYVRVGDWILWVWGALALLFIGAGVVAPRRMRRP